MTNAPDQHPHFEIVRQGFHPEQVRTWMEEALAHIRALEQRIASEVTTVSSDVVRAASHADPQKLVGDLMKIALDELAGRQAAAQADIEKSLRDAAAQAADIIQRARDEAGRVAGAAHEQADTVLTGARADAKRMTDEAAARALAVKDGAERRLQMLMAQHAETVRRLTQIHQVTGGLLDGEQARGSLSDEADRIAPAVSASAEAAAPAELTAAASFPAQEAAAV